MIDSIYKEFISQFGIWGVLIASLTAIFVGGGIYFVQLKIKELFSKRSMKDLDDIVDEISLEDHRIFSIFEHQLSYKIPNLSIFPEKPVRERLLKDLLTAYVRSFHETCKEMVNYDTTNWSNEKWANKMISDITVALKSFDEECINLGIPPVIIQKYNTWNRLSLDNLLELIRSLSTSGIFEGNKVKTGAILVGLESLIVTTISDAEHTLRTLNGEISGQEYRGGIIED